MLLAATSFQSLLRNTHRVEEVSDFMRILARGGHLDGAGPVEVEVAQSERQLLDFQAIKRRIISAHVEVSRQDAALVRRGRRHEEVEALV